MPNQTSIWRAVFHAITPIVSPFLTPREINDWDSFLALMCMFSQVVSIIGPSTLLLIIFLSA